MRIPYLNTPCKLNETCFHGECLYVDDFLLGWYEFCSCHYSYSGYECNEQTKLNRTDWFILLTCIITCLCTVLCLIFIPFFYNFLKDDYYPHIIECTRARPYVEVNSPIHPNVRIYRIPSEYLSRRRTIIDRLTPLHTISSLAHMRFQRRNEQIHI